MSCYFEIFTSCQGSIQNFSKHHYKCKTVSTKFIAKEETANIKIFTGKPTRQFCLLLWLKSRSARGSSHHPAFWATAELLVTSFIVLSTQWMKKMTTWGRSQITSYCFQNFLTSKNIFITLQYSGHIETDNRGMYSEHSGNITK